MYAFITRFIFFISLITSSVAAFAVTPMVSGGSNHTVALNSDGTVMAWGFNSCGQLGDGTTTKHSTPAVVPGLIDVVSLVTRSHGTLALKSDGTVWSWGCNGSGELGDGTTTNRLSPVVVSGISGVVAVAKGYGHSVALKSDGTVLAWGDNRFGQLGDGTTTNRLSPVVVPGLAGVVALAAGMDHTVALKSDGAVVAWGDNYYGQLGDGTTINRLSPVVVLGLTGVTALAASDHTVALKSDGTVVAWGSNDFGQLGDGTLTNRLNPAVVPGLSGVAALGAYGRRTMALKADGTVVGWGINDYGQLGDGTLTNRLSPVVVPGLTGVTALAVGLFHTLALKLDGTMMAWGYNFIGQLGDGTTVNRLNPVGVLGFGGSTAPELFYSTASGYGTVGAGASPVTGFLDTLIKYKAVYVHGANTAPSAISVCIDAQPCNVMSVDTSAAAALRDGNYTNGEQYVYSTTLTAGPHSYYFIASDGTISTSLPATGSLSGPTISDLSITTSSLPSGTVGVAYSQTALAATGGTPPYSWSANLPGGLSLNASTGEISGTPTRSGTFVFSVYVTDAASIVLSRVFSMTVAADPAATVPGAPTMGTAAAGDARATVSFTPPTSNGGDAIIRYTVSCSPACIPVSGTTSPFTVTGLTNGTSYTFTVTATNNVGTGPASAASNSVTPMGPLLPPTGLTVTAISATRIDLAWNASTDPRVTQYKIYTGTVMVCITTPCPSTLELIATVSGTSYSHFNGSTSTRYSVASCDALGNCSWRSAEKYPSLANDTTPPTVPGGLTANVVSSTQINLTWTASTDNVGVTSYTVYRNGVQVGTTTGTSYSDTGLTSATTYSYTVAACDAAGNCSAQSAAVTATTPDNIAPTVPTGLTASAVSATQINLTWTASADNVGVTSYTVYRNGVPLVSGNVTSYSDTGLTALTSYSYTVSACDAAGNCSTQSAAVTATTLEGVPPTVPTKLMTSAFSTTQINLTWRASTDNVGVTGYKVYRNGVQVGAPTGTSFSDTGLTAATSYKYTVAACDAAGNCSAQSATVTGTTKRK